jgi:clan AA aspartic protease
MHAFLDDDDQAFMTFDCGQGPLDFLIDTGFNGSLIIGEEVFDLTDAIPAGAMTADLASNQTFQYQTYLIEFEWCGQYLITRILVGSGKECLIGTALLNPHRLEIDYGSRTVQLIPATNW